MATNSGVSTIDEFPSIGEDDFKIDIESKEGQGTESKEKKEEPKSDGTKDDKSKVEKKEGDSSEKDSDSVDKKKEDDSDDSKKEEGDSKEEEPKLFEDEEGNVIDANGEIVIKKDDVKRDDDGNIIVPNEDDNINKVGVSVATKFGVDLKDDKGEVKKYEATDEGIALLVEDIATKVIGAKEDALFEEYPQMKDYLNHLMAGGQPENYFKHVEETSITKYALPKDDDKNESSNAARKAILKEEQLIKNGYYDIDDAAQRSAILARANKHVDRIADSGDEELVEEAKLAKQSIDDINEKRRSAKAAADKAAITARQEQVNQYIDKIKTTVSSRKLHSITIPESDILAFTDYLTKPVNPQGQTQEMLDVGKEDLSKSLEIAYSRFKGFDLDALVALKVNQEKANAIRLRKAKPVTVGVGKRNKRQGSANLDDITLDNLIG